MSLQSFEKTIVANPNAPVQADRVLLFAPDDKDLREQYPELKDEAEFKLLEKEELWFVWHYANATAPFYRTTPLQTKISKCYDAAFLTTGSDVKKAQYLNQDFPSKVKGAIDRMRLYNPDVRNRSLGIYKQIFKEFEGIITRRQSALLQRTDDSVLTELEMVQDKLFVETASRIIKELPDLQKKIENGFGLKVLQADNTVKGSDGAEYFTLAFNRATA